MGVDMYGPAERELRRLGRQCAGVLHLVVATVACVLVVFTAPTGTGLVTVGALTVWSAGYFLLSRTAGTWLVAADAAIVSTACLTQRWTVPPEALNGNTSWVMAITSIAVATWQWHGGVRTGAVATAAAILANLAGSGVTSASLSVTVWLAVEAALSSGLYHLVRTGAREADRMMAGAERTRRDATVAAARRADEREHLAAIHDTAAATFHAIGAGVVTGREPWLAKQLADALEEVTGAAVTLGVGLRPPPSRSLRSEASSTAILPRGPDIPRPAHTIVHNPIGSTPSERDFHAPGGPPISILPQSTDSSGLTDLVPLLGDVVRHSPVVVELSASQPVPLPAAVAVAICRAAREALLNVARHAGVDTATVRLTRRPGGVLVEIADRGVGFDPAQVSVHRRGITLSLVDRMVAVGGRAVITSGVGRGTRVRLEWPDG
jgi:hypothetical protein